MRVLVIGASKGIGLETIRQALAAGYDVRALARSATSINLSDAKLKKVQGDALNQQDVEAALAGVDAVIVTLGVGLGDLFKPVHLFSRHFCGKLLHCRSHPHRPHRRPARGILRPGTDLG